MKNLKILGTTLSKVQQTQIVGGNSTCAYYNGETGEVDYNLTSSQAQGMLQNASDHWCCRSCNTASWFNNHDGFYDDILEPR